MFETGMTGARQERVRRQWVAEKRTKDDVSTIRDV